MGRFSFPREVMWYRAPGNSLDVGFHDSAHLSASWSQRPNRSIPEKIDSRGRLIG